MTETESAELITIQKRLRQIDDEARASEARKTESLGRHANDPYKTRADKNDAEDRILSLHAADKRIRADEVHKLQARMRYLRRGEFAGSICTVSVADLRNIETGKRLERDHFIAPAEITATITSIWNCWAHLTVTDPQSLRRIASALAIRNPPSEFVCALSALRTATNKSNNGEAS